MNTYLYAFADPLGLIDPLGLRVILMARDLDGVFIGRHQFLVIIPDKTLDFQGDFTIGGGHGNFRLQDLGNGEMGFIIGAQNNVSSDNDRLIAQVLFPTINGGYFLTVNHSPVDGVPHVVTGV